MKMHGPWRAVVAADDAGSSGLSDQLQLCASPPVHDALRPALLAAVVATPLEDESGHPRVLHFLKISSGRPDITRTVVRVADGAATPRRRFRPARRRRRRTSASPVSSTRSGGRARV